MMVKTLISDISDKQIVGGLDCKYQTEFEMIEVSKDGSIVGISIIREKEGGQ